MMQIDNQLQAGPFIKWAGGKARLAPIIEEIAQQYICMKKIDTYIEPFVGGGAMFFYLAHQYNFKNKVIMDINKELINCYQVIKNSPEELINELNTLEKEYNSSRHLEIQEKHFYRIRDLYNVSIINEGYNPILVAAYFIYLNKLGFNGLYRVNRKGLYNVPFGKRKKAILYDESNIIRVNQVLRDTTILHGDYHDSLQFAGDKSLYYFDPPYRPISTSSSFTSYAKSDFNDNNQVELKLFCDMIKEKKGKIMLSNSDPKHTNPDDNFFDDLYKDYVIERIFASRAIGASSFSRGKVSEIVVIGS